MAIELHPTNPQSIDKGQFPLNHDCILKVCYIADSPLRFQYFTCQSQHSGLISSLFGSLSVVRSVKFVSVDKLPDIW